MIAAKAERDREDADIDRLTELANDCVARGAQYIEDTIGELDNVLAPTLSTAPRVKLSANAARSRMVGLLEIAKELEEAQARASVPVAAATADAPDSAAGKAENPGQEPEAASEFISAPTPTGEGKAVTPGAGNAEAAQQYPEGQGSQLVLKAERDSADATDRDAPANASPSVGSMGAGQPADAGPAGGELPMLQDQCRGLTDALASKPDAMLHAREAAAAITPRRIILAEPDQLEAAVLTSPILMTQEVESLRARFEALSAHALSAWNGKFKHHPKVSPEWFATLRALAEAGVEAREVA